MKFKLPHPPSKHDLENMLGNAMGHHGNAAEMHGKAKDAVGAGKSLIGAQEQTLKNRAQQGSGLIAEAREKAAQVAQGSDRLKGMVGEGSGKAHEASHVIQQKGEAAAKVGHNSASEAMSKMGDAAQKHAHGHAAEAAGKGQETLSKVKGAGGKAGKQLVDLGQNAEKAAKSLF